MEFKDVLLHLIDSHNLTAYRLAKSIGVSQSLISYWRRGIKKPSAENLQKLSEYFNVTVDYLLTGENQKKASGPQPEEDDDNIDINDINFALSGEVHELSEDEIQEIISVAKFVRKQRKLRDQKKASQKKTSDGEKKDG